jgi:hypothetical protein
MSLKRSWWVLVLLLYIVLFIKHEQFDQNSTSRISFPLPPIVQKTALGYLRQIGGEMHFIKTAVFLGGYGLENLTSEHADRLARNFDLMAELHPAFIDTYFLSQSTLTYLGPEMTRENNEILKKGMAALPEYWLLPFYIGFNHFYYLQEKTVAAEYLLAASKLPGAATWLGHLASMLTAEGGDIRAGLIWLKTIHQNETDEAARKSYEKDIVAFENALAVQDALSLYQQKYGGAPFNLDVLVPEFLPYLPEFDGRYYLEWDPPTLKLKRPPASATTRH